MLRARTSLENGGGGGVTAGGFSATRESRVRGADDGVGGAVSSEKMEAGGGRGRSVGVEGEGGVLKAPMDIATRWKFSNVSLLLNSSCKVTKELSFEKFD